MREEASTQVRLAARPTGTPDARTWQLTQASPPTPGEGQVLVRNEYISVDPAMRGWIGATPTYTSPVEVGDVMRARAAGRVVASRDPSLPEGTSVVGFLGVQSHALARRDQVRVVDASAVPLIYQLSALGAPGMTAYFGLLEVGGCRPGETVVVSAAAGAVGQMVVQIALIMGCRVIGIAGGASKCDFVQRRLGATACIDYKADNVAAQMRAACPYGIDVYFDNVGGDILNDALAQIGLGARIVVCGAVSQYDNLGAVQGPGNYLNLLMQRASLRGMLVGDFEAKFPVAIAAMSRWMAQSRLDCQHHCVDGIENFPDALQQLFAGRNVGKVIVRVR
ncbi:NADP-dependent oxidoreductase [Variovorax sp. J31P207]|uniref:NADP-dependent oxidoreductase n=1 Tax=Variovorax sp. J31P207 TaxID=3053510 RepID=UPI002575E2EB|nr:NADP-dependent oxidoreductase [Variovorax sp. J31P207]MDM0066880.1 NADP-dependent oxidoreductase [Variovorax sp. J31P207]